MTPTSPETGTNQPKKPYEPPRLEVYGNIRQITQAAGTDGRGDGGGHTMSKTG